MIAIAQDRAQARGVSNVEFEVSDIETLDLAPRSLDAVLARWSMMFVGDRTAVLAKLARALRPGGHLVTVVWESPGEVPALSLAKSAVHRHFN
jgi:ubiquinone/menaquinone biosynthesis C-methylase UbiE